MDSRITFLSCFGWLWLVGMAVWASGQQPGKTFERCFEFASELNELNDAFVRQQASVKNVLDSINALQPRVEQSEQKLKQLFDQQSWASLQREKLDVQAASVRAQGSTNSLTRSQALSIADAVASLGVQADMMTHQMRTLDAAGRIVVQQRLTLLQQWKSLLEEYRAYHDEQLELFDKYWRLADVMGLRCDWELQAALRALERAADDNPGAIFVRAMIAMRSDRLDEAAQWLDELKRFDEIQYVVLAARAELQARLGKTEEALQSLRTALAKAKSDPRVRMHRAVIFTGLGRYRDAETEWEAVLKQGVHEIKARCGIAMLNVLVNNPNDKQKARALENAELANRLAGEDDWPSFVALALAHAINDHADEATAAADQATALAMGSQRIRCLDLSKRLKAGEKPAWKLVPIQ